MDDDRSLFTQKLPPTNSKLSYIYGEYMFHYIVENQWIYLCICDKKFQRMLAFQFLNDLMAFVKNPEATSSLPTPAHDTQSQTPLQQFLNKQMVVDTWEEKYNSIISDKHHKIYSDISDLKDTMIENIDKVLERGERIDLLVDKSESLTEHSFVFNKNARRLKDKQWWQNTKLILLFGGIGIFLLYLIVSTQCGGVTWPNC